MASIEGPSYHSINRGKYWITLNDRSDQDAAYLIGFDSTCEFETREEAICALNELRKMRESLVPKQPPLQPARKRTTNAGTVGTKREKVKEAKRLTWNLGFRC